MHRLPAKQAAPRCIDPELTDSTNLRRRSLRLYPAHGPRQLGALLCRADGRFLCCPQQVVPQQDAAHQEVGQVCAGV
jgi:hypothetical protein